jgi:hypothetical protein
VILPKDGDLLLPGALVDIPTIAIVVASMNLGRHRMIEMRA